MNFFNLFNFFKSKDQLKSNQKKLLKYYQSQNMDLIPHIPSEEESARILSQLSSFSFSTVPKHNMMYIPNYNLTPGHIVLLWWLNNPRTNKNTFPLYFLFEYGLDFHNSTSYLRKEKLLNNDLSLTAEAIKILDNQKEIIRKHKATKSMLPNGEIEYLFKDKERTRGVTKFETSGDYVDDQFIGRSFEANKDYDNAILAYKSAIELARIKGNGIPPNPYMRLAIIYRRLKDKESEIKILKEGIATTNYPSAKTTHTKLVERLSKLQ